LVARSTYKLAARCDELKGKHKIDAQFVALDLTERDATQKLFDETTRRELEVETLINNAGFGSMGGFTKFDIERDRSMIELNITALVALTHLYLPLMRARRGGAIINVASTAAFQAVPYMATYAATKAFVLSFSEALWEENRAYGVKVLALCPGTTDTNFFEAAHGKPPPPSITQTPAEVVETALRALARNKSHVVSGWANFVTVVAERLVPRSLLTRIAGRVVRSRHQLNGEDR
jgi:short-subunit dehydrogenase